MHMFSKLQRLALTLVLATAGAVLAIAPARADYCGIQDDIGPVVKLTVAQYPKFAYAAPTIDPSYIKVVSINGTYGYSLVDTGSDRLAFYWEKPTGTWHLAAARKPPASWDKQLLGFLQNNDCTNPNWKKH